MWNTRIKGVRMPQLSLYIDQDTLTKVSDAARAEHVSVSKFVTGILARTVSDTWSQEFLDTYGSITDPTFVRPEELDPADDVPRLEF
jgi:hypothetical protein